MPFAIVKGQKQELKIVHTIIVVHDYYVWYQTILNRHNTNMKSGFYRFHIVAKIKPRIELNFSTVVSIQFFTHLSYHTLHAGPLVVFSTTKLFR